MKSEFNDLPKYEDCESNDPMPISFKEKFDKIVIQSIRDYDYDGDDSTTDEEEKVDYTQWVKRGSSSFFPEGKIKLLKKVPAGVYDIRYSEQYKSYFLLHKNVNLDELLVFPDKIQDAILTDIKTFWEKEEMFKKYKFVYKRGILLWGRAGNGKSCIINLLSKELVQKHKGVVFFLQADRELDTFIDFMSTTFKQIEPNTKILCIIEDIENFTNQHETESKLLNLLDGVQQLNNIVFIASTNYPEKLQERILNRPSRFDRRYEIKSPNSEIREFYFKNKIKKEELDSINLKEWVDQTKNLTISHLSEIVKSVFCLGGKFPEVIKELKKMNDEKLSSFNYDKSEEDKYIGFQSKR